MSMPDNRVPPTARSDISAQELGDEVMLYDCAGEKIHVLNHSAYAVWKLCDGNNNVQDMQKKLHELFPDAGEALAQDIPAILDEFHAKSLLKC